MDETNPREIPTITRYTESFQTIIIQDNFDHTAEDILTAFSQNSGIEQFKSEITALYQTTKRQWKMTFRQRGDPEQSVRLQVLEAAKEGIPAKNGNITFDLPKKPWTRLVFRGTPEEMLEERFGYLVERMNIGKIKRIQKMYMRNTKIYNGYIAVFVEEPIWTKIPEFTKLDAATVKIYLPPGHYQKNCKNCFQTGHTTYECTNLIVCRTCKKPGHKQNECKEYKKNFPAITTKTTTVVSIIPLEENQERDTGTTRTHSRRWSDIVEEECSQETPQTPPELDNSVFDSHYELTLQSAPPDLQQPHGKRQLSTPSPGIDKKIKTSKSIKLKTTRLQSSTSQPKTSQSNTDSSLETVSEHSPTVKLPTSVTDTLVLDEKYKEVVTKEELKVLDKFNDTTMKLIGMTPQHEEHEQLVEDYITCKRVIDRLRYELKERKQKKDSMEEE